MPPNQPYGDSNFSVDYGSGDAGFDRVMVPVLTTQVVEYRNGNDPTGGTHKAPARPHYGNAILERGVTGTLDLYQWWLEAEQNGPNTFRTVLIKLLDAPRGHAVLTWVLQRAFPVRFEYGPLVAQGSSVLVERLELACESVDIQVSQ
jgi:phage tail-like protein